jgi:site-specific DNA recombinase
VERIGCAQLYAARGIGKVEIDEGQAAIVRRIFELYANGASPRTIAMTLNDEGVPSPASQWKRTSRRKSGWLASAIHGDVERGSGILNNPRYIGIVKRAGAVDARCVR